MGGGGVKAVLISCTRSVLHINDVSHVHCTKGVHCHSTRLNHGSACTHWVELPEVALDFEVEMPHYTAQAWIRPCLEQVHSPVCTTAHVRLYFHSGMAE